MGTAYYLDISSITVKKNDKNNALVFAENIIAADADNGYTITRTITEWYCQETYRNEFYKAYIGQDGEIWKEFYINDTHGYNMLTRNGFLMGWKIIFGGDWPDKI